MAGLCKTGRNRTRTGSCRRQIEQLNKNLLAQPGGTLQSVIPFSGDAPKSAEPGNEKTRR
jgi:hypothetical protein